MSEHEQIAKKFCEKMGYTLLFVNEYKIGVEKPDTREMFTMTWKEMAERLEEVQKGEK